MLLLHGLLENRLYFIYSSFKYLSIYLLYLFSLSSSHVHDLFRSFNFLLSNYLDLCTEFHSIRFHWRVILSQDFEPTHPHSTCPDLRLRSNLWPVRFRGWIGGWVSYKLNNMAPVLILLPLCRSSRSAVIIMDSLHCYDQSRIMKTVKTQPQTTRAAYERHLSKRYRCRDGNHEHNGRINCTLAIWVLRLPSKFL